MAEEFLHIYYILQIPDRDTLLVMSEDIGRGGIGFFDRGAMRKDFSAKGKTFAVEKILHTQLRPNVRIKKQEYRLDGAPLPKEDFAERGTVLVCDEVYEVVSPAALLRFVLRNPGRKVDLTDPAIDAALEITNRYTFTPDGTTHLRQKVKFMERISLRQWGLLHTQSIYTPGDNPFREYFIPKTVPFVQDGVAYDFAKGFRVLKPLPVVRITPDRIADPANPPDRFIQIAGCGTPDAGRVRETGLVIGYSLTGGATLPSIRKNSAAPMPVWINYTQKSYPCIISSVGGVAVEAGKELEASGYRKIFDPGRFGKAAQASYTVNDGGRKLLYLLFTEAGEAAIPPGFHKVVEKSAGLTISGNRAIAAAPGDYAVME